MMSATGDSIPAIDSSSTVAASTVAAEPVHTPAEETVHIPAEESVHTYYMNSPIPTFTVDSLTNQEEEETPHEEIYGILLSPPEIEPEQEFVSANTGISFIISALIILFCVICFHFRNNRKYASALLKNLVEVKVRGNVFDETVRETSFLILLNMLWCVATGVILFSSIMIFTATDIYRGDSFSLPDIEPAAGMALCMIIAVIYTLFMTCSYLTVGSVFSDITHAKIWLKGYTAGQGLLGFIYFPLALLFICYPENSYVLFWVAAATFICAKLLFIWKGLRIFYTQSSSWVLFLYYLCSLEIVPLILSYLAAIALWCMIG